MESYLLAGRELRELRVTLSSIPVSYDITNISKFEAADEVQVQSSCEITASKEAE